MRVIFRGGGETRSSVVGIDRDGFLWWFVWVDDCDFRVCELVEWFGCFVVVVV